MWDNRMIENRLAVAQQLMEVSRIMENVARDQYELCSLKWYFVSG